MDAKKKSFNQRAFVAMMAGFTGLSLPFSGLILHAHSDGRILAGRHAWFTMHVFFGIFFLIFAGWHIVLNRRPFFKYFKSGVVNRLPLSREAYLAIAITTALFVMMIIHSF